APAAVDRVAVIAGAARRARAARTRQFSPRAGASIAAPPLRRLRWLWGAFEGLRRHVAGLVPEAPWPQVDPSALPVTPPSRVRGAEAWRGPGGLVTGFGFDAAHRDWCSGFRLAVRTDLGARLVRAWGLVPAAVDGWAVADGLLAGAPPRACCSTGASSAPL